MTPPITAIVHVPTVTVPKALWSALEDLIDVMDDVLFEPDVPSDNQIERMCARYEALRGQMSAHALDNLRRYMLAHPYLLADDRPDIGPSAGAELAAHNGVEGDLASE